MSVDFNTSGFLQPLGGSGGAFKHNSTIPVKIVFTDCNGSVPTNLAPTIEVTSGGPNEPLVSGIMRFSSGQYIFSLSARSLPDPAATYMITVTVPLNGQTLTFPLTLRP